MSIFIRLKVFSCHKPPMIFWLRNIFSVKVITVKKAANMLLNIINFSGPATSKLPIQAPCPMQKNISKTQIFPCKIKF